MVNKLGIIIVNYNGRNIGLGESYYFILLSQKIEF